MIIDQNDTCPRPKGQNQLLKMVVLIFSLHFFQSPPTKQKFNMITTFDTQRMKRALMSNAGNECPDQTARMRSLIRTFVARLQTQRILLNISTNWEGQGLIT